MWANTFNLYSLIDNWYNIDFEVFKEIFTYISPFIGLLGGFLIARKSFMWQLKQQEINEEQYIVTLVERSLDEMVYNQSVMEIMLDAFNQSNSSRNDHWEWLETIADSLQFNSIKVLLNNVTKQNRLELAIDQLYVSFHETLACYNDIKQGYAKHRFLYSFKSDSRTANETFENIKNNLSLTIKGSRNYAEIVSKELNSVRDGEIKAK
ncbi:hypothetical protein ACGTN9_17500 [Halobacillus sp. MO56]